MDPEKKPVEVYAEKGETRLPEASPEELKALASAYAKYLAEHDIKPGDLTFTDSVPELEMPEKPQETEAEEVIAELSEVKAAEEPKAVETPVRENPASSPKKQKKQKKQKKT